MECFLLHQRFPPQKNVIQLIVLVAKSSCRSSCDKIASETFWSDAWSDFCTKIVKHRRLGWMAGGRFAGLARAAVIPRRCCHWKLKKNFSPSEWLLRREQEDKLSCCLFSSSTASIESPAWCADSPIFVVHQRFTFFFILHAGNLRHRRVLSVRDERIGGWIQSHDLTSALSLQLSGESLLLATVRARANNTISTPAVSDFYVQSCKGCSSCVKRRSSPWHSPTYPTRRTQIRWRKHPKTSGTCPLPSRARAGRWRCLRWRARPRSQRMPRLWGRCPAQGTEVRQPAAAFASRACGTQFSIATMLSFVRAASRPNSRSWLLSVDRRRWWAFCFGSYHAISQEMNFWEILSQLLPFSLFCWQLAVANSPENHFKHTKFK